MAMVKREKMSREEDDQNFLLFNLIGFCFGLVGLKCLVKNKPIKTNVYG